MLSVLWHCWLGVGKSIRPVKNWVVGCWHGYLSGASCRLAYGPADATATHCLASVISGLVLPFWYRLTWAVFKRVCVCVSASWLNAMCTCAGQSRYEYVIFHYWWYRCLLLSLLFLRSLVMQFFYRFPKCFMCLFWPKLLWAQKCYPEIARYILQ